MVLQAAKDGDKICNHIVTDLANHLGLGVSNLVNLFNPAVVVLDKRLELAGDLLRDQVMQVIPAAGAEQLRRRAQPDLWQARQSTRPFGDRFDGPGQAL